MALTPRPRRARRRPGAPPGPAPAPIPAEPSTNLPPGAPAPAPEEGASEEFSILPLGLGWEGSIFTGDAGKRFSWLLFIGLTYRLAFGRNDHGEYYVESGVNGALDAYGRGSGYRNEPKKTRAVLRARLAGTTVARTGSKKTVRKGVAGRAREEVERNLKRTSKGDRTSTASGSSSTRKTSGTRTSSSSAPSELEKKRAAKRGRDKAEARSGLQNLGYSKTEANQLLASVGDKGSAEEYLKAALAARNRRMNNDATG